MANRFPEIICTLGEATDDLVVLRKTVGAGMEMARINSATASDEALRERIRLVRATADTPIVLDLKGPQLRVDNKSKEWNSESFQLRGANYRQIAQGDLIFVGFDSGPLRFNYDFERDLGIGDLVTFENGRIRTVVADPQVENIQPQTHAVLLEVIDAGDGFFPPQMDANVPGRVLRVPRLSDRDRQAIRIGTDHGIEWYALSFTRNARDLHHLHHALADAPDAGIIAKIEDRSGIKNLASIAATAASFGRLFAVMIARGDLYIELPFVELASAQHDLITECQRLGVPCIVATGLLKSMRRHRRPTRAEVCDVAGAVTAGASSFLLSEETALGVNPALVVQTLQTLLLHYRKNTD